jgi:Ni,Fe-hydrogenase III small subunit/ferredoxin
MRNIIKSIINTGILTNSDICPELPVEADGLPAISAAPCRGEKCGKCAAVCPMKAIEIKGEKITLDRGRCLGCHSCTGCCPSGTIIHNRSTRTAVLRREDLILTNADKVQNDRKSATSPFINSLHIREVSTGCNACDLEVLASTNAVFDIARFGIHITASPRFADALLVTGPVGMAMHDPLQRCYDAMAEPRLVIAAGTSAICGGLHNGGYAEANGVDSILPVSAYIPGEPPHPWSIIHGALLAMGRMQIN